MKNYMKFTGRRALLLSAATLVTMASPAFSQEVENTTQEKVMDVITVYATTNPIKVFDFPGQVSVVSRDDIELYAPASISDMLRDVPGVEFGGGPRRSGETPSIRGRGGENVLILLDGARQSFISAHDGRFFLDPELIKTAEVVKGPASSLYGSGAVGGVLAFETIDAADMLEGDETAGVRLRFGYQSVNEDILGTVTAYTKQGNFDVLGSFGLRSSGDIELGSGLSLPSDDDIMTALVKASYKFSDDFNIEGSWQHFSNSAFEPNNGQGVNVGNAAGGVLIRDVDKDTKTNTLRVSANYNPSANDFVNATMTGYRTSTSVEELDNSLPRITIRDIDTTGIGIRNASQLDLGIAEATLTIGADWYKDDQVGIDDNAANNTRDGVPDGSSEFIGVYAQLEAKIDNPIGLGNDLLIIPGVRYDDFKSSDDTSAADSKDNKLSPRLGVSYGGRTLRVFGSYTEGFRAPSINELYLDGIHFSIPLGPTLVANNNFVPNPNLIPEKTKTFEFGTGVNFDNVLVPGDSFTAKGSYYTSDVQDLINISVNFGFTPTCFFPPNTPCNAGTTISENLDSATIDGVELEAFYNSKRLSMHASYGSINGTNDANGEDLGILTPDRFSLDTRILAPEWDASFGSRLQIVGDFERLDANGAGNLVIGETREGYAQVDLYATWKPSLIEGVRFDVGVDNVFDTNFERINAGVSEPGINFKAAVSLQKNF